MWRSGGAEGGLLTHVLSLVSSAAFPHPRGLEDREFLLPVLLPVLKLVMGQILLNNEKLST